MKFIIDTDLSVQGTTISIDGKDVRKTSKLASISFYADAPNKKYEDSGYVSVSISSFDDEGNIQRVNYSKNEKINETLKPIGLKDDVKESDIIMFIGDEIEVEKKDLIDSIIKKSAEDKLACPDSETLLKRSLDSLRDKAIDLGIALADA